MWEVSMQEGKPVNRLVTTNRNRGRTLIGILTVLVALTGCQLFLGPEISILVQITFTDATLVSGAGIDDEWSYTVNVKAAGVEQAITMGQSISVACSTWDWVTFKMRVVEDAPLIDDVGYQESSILGKDIRDQSPYGITREVTVSESGGDPGSALWRFGFSLSTSDT